MSLKQMVMVTCSQEAAGAAGTQLAVEIPLPLLGLMVCVP